MITKLVHLGVQVNSFAKAKQFYCDGLGFEFIYSGTIGEFRHIIDPSVDPASDPREQMGYVRVAEGQYFEIFEKMVSPPDFDPKPINKYDDMAFVEIGLNVADLQDAVQRLSERGITVKDGCCYDADQNCYRLIEIGGEKKKHIITGLAYVAMKVNDMESQAAFYQTLGLVPKTLNENGDIEMQTPECGSIILIKSEKPVKRYYDTPLGHFCFLTDGYEGLQKCAESWGKQGIVSYRNSNKDEILKTSKEAFNPDQGPDGTIGIRIFDPEDNYIEVVHMPEENRQRCFEKMYPFE